MLSRSLTRFAAFGIVAAFSWLATPDAVSQSNDIRNMSFDDFKKRTTQEYETFKDSVKQDYVAFRDSINREYAKFMRNPWTASDLEEDIEAPLNKEPEPDIEPEEEHDRPITNSMNIKFEAVVPITWPSPQPVPFGEIEEMPTNKKKRLVVKYYGTPVVLRDADLSDFKLNGNDENAFADGWEILSQSTTNNLIKDCLYARDSLNLPDWGYLKFLEMVSSKILGENTNEQRLLQGFLMNQSGYKVRFSYDKLRQLHILFASPGIMYERPSYYRDNTRFYSYTRPQTREVYICNFQTPGEKAVDFGIHKAPRFDFVPCETRVLNVEYHPELVLKLTPNKNLIDFYNDYPVATPGPDQLSLWSIHGNTPVSEEVKNELYPALRKAVEGKNQYQALQLLLKVAQSFPYGYDDEIWGRDRAFWMEESWTYPKSDCEDHAINFSHLVRDILDLDVCLIYYPGHLSSCVALTESNPPGDYIMYEGKKYIVCDPTYLFSNAGNTAPSNKNSQASLIPLRK